MAGKEDYKSIDVRSRRRLKVPRVTLTKVEVDNDDKRTRAELLDSIEDLFQNTYHAGRKHKYDKDVDLDNLKAILTMLVLSATNSEDDTIGASQQQVNAINLNATNTSINAANIVRNLDAINANTTNISSQASSIATNSAKTGITSSQASAISANTSKRDARYIYQTFIASFNGNINTAQFVPLSDGETETTNNLTRRNNFIAPCDGFIHKVFVRSNASLQSGGVGVTLTGKLHKYGDGSDSNVSQITATTTTKALSRTNMLDFSSVSNNDFRTGDRLLVSLQAPLNANKNYYVTVVFKLDQTRLD